MAPKSFTQKNVSDGRCLPLHPPLNGRTDEDLIPLRESSSTRPEAEYWRNGNDTQRKYGWVYAKPPDNCAHDIRRSGRCPATFYSSGNNCAHLWLPKGPFPT